MVAKPLRHPFWNVNDLAVFGCRNGWETLWKFLNNVGPLVAFGMPLMSKAPADPARSWPPTQRWKTHYAG